jgi:hypothetical protein
MRHLLLKDFMLQKRILVLVCVYVIVLGFLFQGMTDGQIVLAMSIVGFILIIFSTAWESKSDVLWNSVPIPTWKIVGAKYLSIFVYLAGALALALLSSAVGKLISSSETALAVNFPSILSGVLIVALVSGVYWPLYYALGYVKSRYTGIILYVGCLYLMPSLSQFREMHFTALMMILSVGIVGILVAVSFGISLYFYQRREF